MSFYRAHKFNATRVSHSGFSFASQLEAALYDLLKIRELAGEIAELKTQPHVYLTEAKIHMIPDFRFTELKSNKMCFAEAKGFETSDWRIKRKLWTVYGPGNLEIYKGTKKRLILVETIVPSSLK